MANTLAVMVGDSYLPLFQNKIRDRFVLIEGRRGTAKTRSILTRLVCQALRYPKSRWLLARSSRVRLSETVLETLEEQVLPLFRIPFRPIDRSARTHYDLPGDSKFVLMGMDDIRRGQSLEVAGGYVSEVSEILAEDTAAALTGAMRQDCGVPFHQMLLDVNPTWPGHWSNKAAQPASDDIRKVETPEDYARLLAYNAAPAPAGKWKRIITVAQDNPGYFDAAKWQWTPIGKSYYDGLSDLTGYLRAQWFEGRWVAPSGTVFGAEYDETRNACQPFNIPPTWPIWCYVDPGYDHPCAVLWFTMGPTGRVWIIDELYERQTPISDDPDTGRLGIVSLIRERERQRGFAPIQRFLDPRYGFSHTAFAQNGSTIQEQFQKEGLHFMPWPRTEGLATEASVNDVRRWLTKGKLIVFSRCVNTIQEFQSWRYKRMANGELPNGDDAFEDRSNHAMDCVRGFAINDHRFAETTPPAPYEPPDDEDVIRVE